MTVIKVDNLTKVFRIPRKEPGLGGAVKGLFAPKFGYKTAVDLINFQLEAGKIVGYRFWQFGLRHYNSTGT